MESWNQVLDYSFSSASRKDLPPQATIFRRGRDESFTLERTGGGEGKPCLNALQIKLRYKYTVRSASRRFSTWHRGSVLRHQSSQPRTFLRRKRLERLVLSLPTRHLLARRSKLVHSSQLEDDATRDLAQ